MNIAGIILAAGMGKRMGGNYPKVLFELEENKLLIDYVVESLKSLNPERIVIVVGFGKELVRAHLSKSDCIFAEQKFLLGTGDAVKSAMPCFEDYDGDILVLCGDVPLIPKETLTELVSFHQNGGYDATLLTVILPEPDKYGRIIRSEDGKNILKIVEAKDANADELAVREINSGIYVYTKKALAENLKLIGKENAQGEFYLTDIVDILNRKNGRVGGFVYKGAFENLSGVNKPEDLEMLKNFKKSRNSGA